MGANMSNMRKNLLFSILSIIVLALALTLTLLDALLPIGILIHPVLTFLLVNFLGFGLILFVKGITVKSNWFMFISNILLSLALFYLIITFIKWWLALIIVFVFSVIISILTVCICGNPTEYADNKKDGYLSYEQRKALKEEDVSSQELPEIKSFK